MPSKEKFYGIRPIKSKWTCCFKTAIHAYSFDTRKKIRNENVPRKFCQESSNLPFDASRKRERPGYHFRGLKIFGGHKRPLKKYKTQIYRILRDHLRSAPAPGYNFPHPHLYFVLCCAPGSHFTHPHLFHLSFPHPRSRRKVPYSAVWFRD